jgi:hypothetical protein
MIKLNDCWHGHLSNLGFFAHGYRCVSYLESFCRGWLVDVDDWGLLRRQDNYGCLHFVF